MNVAVLGAGATGREIAETCALGGSEVRLHADDVGTAMDAIEDIERRIEERIETGALSGRAGEAATERLEATTGVRAAVADADLVVETTLDDAEALQERFAAVEEHVARETLVATSESALSVTAAAAGLRHPERALGLHVHRPVSRLMVEVVVTDQTAPAATERAASFVDGLDAVSAVIRDGPGLISVRLALALEAEAMRLVDEGVARVATIDGVLARGYGHETGPLELADRAGLDNRLDALEYLADALGECHRPPAVLEDRVAAGKTGAKAGEGFYLWEGGEPIESAVSGPDLPGIEPNENTG